GGSPRDPVLRARIGLAPQSLALYENLSGRENIAFFARMFGLHGAHLARRVDAALDFVQLADRQHDRAGGYSGGMQRRLNLAAAIVHEPELILLDEPTAGVDPESRNALFENVLALKAAAGRTIVYTTHYMEEVERFATASPLSIAGACSPSTACPACCARMAVRRCSWSSAAVAASASRQRIR
ncbi:MAG: ABC transporter ATP-binding protein, partial [Xanthomonadales bacterium]|nr:ABC transporter ATP-binding protein [Xanthomonadales bacterium]